MSYKNDKKVKEPPEVIDKKIVLCLAKNNEKLGRDDIAERIGNPYQTVKNGLSRLKKQNILDESKDVIKEIGRGSGETRTHVFGYKLRESTDVLIKILYNFLNYLEFKEFHRSDYCQNTINIDFVKNIKSKWKYPDDESIRNRYLNAVFYDGGNGRLYEKTSGWQVQTLNISEEKRLEMANKHIKGSLNYLLDADRPYISDEDILFILKSSPSALKFSLMDLPRDVALSELKNDKIFFAQFKFQWNDPTGISDIYIKNFLISEGIDWVKDAKIELWPTVTVTDGKNSLFFRRNNEQEKVHLKTNKKSYLFDIVKDEGGHSEWIVLLHPDYNTLDEKSLAKILEILPENQKEKYYRKVIEHIHEIFLEQLLMNFISDIRLNHFVSQNTYSTWLDVALSVRFCLNGQKKLHKSVKVGSGKTDYKQHPNPWLLTGEFDECKD